MQNKTENPEDIQRKFYAETAVDYDLWHVENEADPEQKLALNCLSSLIGFYNIKSILDMGAGTGRTILYLKERHPDVKIVGIEPVKELREKGHAKGIDKELLIDGDGYSLQFADREFDLVCEFGVLHHVQYPEKVVDEMLRVSRVCTFISDTNNFGQGSSTGRFIKQLLNAFGLWRLYDYFRTGGKMYQISRVDGLFYSYSVFTNYWQFKEKCELVHVLNLTGNGINPYRHATHAVIWGIKRRS